VASIRCDTSGKLPVWRVRVRVSGHPTASATFTTRGEAEVYARVTELALRGRPIAMPQSGALPSVPSVGSIIDRYRREVLPTKAYNTQIAATRQLNWWLQRIGSLALNAVTPMLVAEAKGELIAKGSKGATVNRYLAALSSVYATAIKDWYIDVNNPVSKIRRMPEGNGKTRYLTDAERPRLLAACKASVSKDLYTIVLLALSTGMRRNEILTLTWEAIDTLRGEIYLKDTKNKEPRSVPLTGEALTLLREARRARYTEPLDTLVFRAPKGAKVYAMNKAWHRALRQAGIDDFCFHSLRHTVGSYLAMQGCTQLDIARVLGHKKVATTQRYTHLSTSHIRGILDNLTSAL
jgi:integrase